MQILLPILYRIPALIIAVTIHEYAKAAASWKLGDNNPKLTGRLTLNPIKHIDPLGAICIMFFGYGWGNPVDTSPMFYKDRKKATMIVYILPSVVNLVFGMMMGFAAYFFNTAMYAEDGTVITAIMVMRDISYWLAFVNAAMALFNIIPVYPLDGAKVLALFLNAETRVRMANNEKWFQLGLVACMFFGVVEMVFTPLVNMLIGFAVMGAAAVEVFAL
jgi:Zn-dependent protease